MRNSEGRRGIYVAAHPCVYVGELPNWFFAQNSEDTSDTDRAAPLCESSCALSDGSSNQFYNHKSDSGGTIHDESSHRP